MRRALLAAVGASTVVGTAGTAAELASDDLGSVATASWRGLLGGVALLVVAAARRERVRVAPDLRRPLVVAASAVAINQFAFLGAVDRAGVAVGTLVTVATIPIASGIADRVVSGLVPTRWWVVGVAVSVGGVAVLARPGSGVDAAGVGLGIVAGALVPVFALVVQRAMTTMAPVAAMATVFGGGSLLLAPVAAVTAGEAFASAGSTWAVLYLGFVTVTLVLTLWAYALRRLTVSDVAAVSPVEPAVAAVLAVTVLDDPVTVALVVGVVLVVAGVTTSAAGARG